MGIVYTFVLTVFMSKLSTSRPKMCSKRKEMVFATSARMRVRSLSRMFIWIAPLELRTTSYTTNKIVAGGTLRPTLRGPVCSPLTGRSSLTASVARRLLASSATWIDASVRMHAKYEMVHERMRIKMKERKRKRGEERKEREGEREKGRDSFIMF